MNVHQLYFKELREKLAKEIDSKVKRKKSFCHKNEFFLLLSLLFFKKISWKYLKEKKNVEKVE